jgi:hypothetical protein
MSTKALVPGNSQRDRLAALSAFDRFAKGEQLSFKEICDFVAADSPGVQESAKGSLLPKNSVASYLGNVKNHLLELNPALASVSGRRLQNVASILDKYCSKRGTEFTQQAPPCTKSDLRALSRAILDGAKNPNDYKDSALLNMLWYLLGRSSDLMCPSKKPSRGLSWCVVY